ncbi:RCC1 domain-containing protein [Sorangium sp. So ce204]|uniref:RCC1 domain-containing protein n=1 Tax=Sorangium sp. So ce204 TaxID=3133288 RepID=UPI003F60D67F
MMIGQRGLTSRRWAAASLLITAPLAGGCSEDYHFTPVRVKALEPAAQIVAGAYHTCAILRNGNTACWGDNDAGQLGDVSIGSLSTSPRWVSLAADPVRLAAGPRHTCALFDEGRVRCWGDDVGGSLGVVPAGCGDTSGGADVVAGGRCPVPPRDVPGLEDVVELAAGGLVEADDPSLGFTCAVRGADTVVCWGDNRSHQLGADPETVVRSEPALVLDLGGFPLRGVTRVAAGEAHACALDAQGDVWCWGDGAAGAVRKEGVRGATDVAAGGRHSCAALGTGQVACWGWNLNGQSGDGPIVDSADEVVGVTLVEGVASAKVVVAGGRHSCALIDDGGVVCWGSNQSGQLGSEEANLVSAPVRAALDVRAVALAAGREHTCALDEEGGVFCWGSDGQGQIGTGRQ